MAPGSIEREVAPALQTPGSVFTGRSAPFCLSRNLGYSTVHVGKTSSAHHFRITRQIPARLMMKFRFGTAMICLMVEPRIAKRSAGRDSKGDRLGISARTSEPLKNAVIEEASRAGMGQSEFVNRLLQFALGVPQLPTPNRNGQLPVPSVDDVPSAAAAAADSLVADLLDDDGEVLAVLDEFDRAAARAGMPPRHFAVSLGHSANVLAAYRSRSAAMSAADLLRAMRIADGIEQAHKAGWSPPPSASSNVVHCLHHNRPRQALAEVLRCSNDLRSALGGGSPAVSAWDAAPYMSFNPRWSALLAAVVAHGFESRSLKSPRWTRRPYLFLSDPWRPFSNDLPLDKVRERTPRTLADRGILLTEDELRQSR
ncbi:hypothetical protein [Nocardioides kongjuensis]|uniref:hypothetical protein n=1 Tax=Nocardioides kongjuensis TaxID=349522 RepID=UPI0031E8824A